MPLHLHLYLGLFLSSNIHDRYLTVIERGIGATDELGGGHSFGGFKRGSKAAENKKEERAVAVELCGFEFQLFGSRITILGFAHSLSCFVQV